MSEKTKKFRPIILKSLFIIMILVIIVLLAFAVMRFIPFLFSSFASVGNSLKFGNDIEIRLSENDLNSNENFRLYWEYTGSEEGRYNLSYACSPNLKLLVDNNEKTELECDRDYPLSASDSFIDLVAVSTKENTYTESEITVSLNQSPEEVVTSASETFSVTNEGSAPINDLSGGATISSQNVDNTNQGSGNTNRGSSNTDNTSNNNTGSTPVVSTIPADLAIFNARAISDTRIVFDVSNIGGRSSGVWYFTYTIPGEGTETSPLQLSLNPGNTIRYTLTFDDIPSGTSIISVDPNNLIAENSETNNVARVFVQGDDGDNRNDFGDDYDPDDEADLVIRNLEAGYMSGSRFREDDNIDERDDAAIRFTVVNIGGESTGSWRFSVDETPYDGSNNDYESRRQDSLRPGESREIIVEFENPDEGRYDIEVEVDSDDDVDEENERNNDDSVRLRVRD